MLGDCKWRPSFWQDWSGKLSVSLGSAVLLLGQRLARIKTINKIQAETPDRDRNLVQGLPSEYPGEQDPKSPMWVG